ncbi:hypothetical protein CCHR01_06726 [Colletotrichum chrysophilum]|uniref:Uncharacterized protein n=1 Tax=Colletotrichum chrysophilum TaxID=1836956 RepID=A0AAD9ARZ2_9PEZI|nr:hypothetical protein CCHR01_06726 [Colletotrichum chrysophilum]
MDYYRSTFSAIVWMDSFLFFYWDIRRYRPVDAENIERLIIDYFKSKVPNITSSQDPSSWDTLLCHLMRSLACLLGIRSNPHCEHGRNEPLQWLNTWKGNPFLNEFGHAHRSDHWTLPLPTHVDRILTLAWKYGSESFRCKRNGCRTGSCQYHITGFNLFPTARLTGNAFRLVLQHTASGDMAQLRPYYNHDRFCIPAHGLSPDGYKFCADRRTINLG